MFIRAMRGVCFAPETGEGTEPEEGDDPAEGDEPEEGDDPAEGDEPEEGDEPATKQKRGETRQQRLANELRVEREKRIAAETRAEERERARASRDDSGEATRIRAEKMDLMDPAEKREFLRDESLKRMEGEIFRTRLESADAKDEAKYDAVAAKNTPQGKYYAKYKERVERELATARRNGNNPSREAIAKLLYADDAFKAKPAKSLGKEKEAAAARVKSAQGAPAAGRGDAGGKKSGGDDSLAAMKARILSREASGAM